MQYTSKVATVNGGNDSTEGVLTVASTADANAAVAIVGDALQCEWTKPELLAQPSDEPQDDVLMTQICGRLWQNLTHRLAICGSESGADERTHNGAMSARMSPVSPGADVTGVSPIPAQNVAAVSPVAAKMWQG